jgi:hypothetical protein
MPTLEAITETWQTIQDFPNYEISSLGNVRNKRKRLLKRGDDSREYYHVRLYKTKDVSSWITIHRLVALAFVPNPDNLPMVDHISGDKHDNRYINLRWCDCKDNLNNHKLNARGEAYDYLAELPDDAIAIIRYKKHELKHVYYSPLEDSVFIWNGLKFQRKIPYFVKHLKHYPAVSVADLTKKTFTLPIPILRNETCHELLARE